MWRASKAACWSHDRHELSSDVQRAAQWIRPASSLTAHKPATASGLARAGSDERPQTIGSSSNNPNNQALRASSWMLIKDQAESSSLGHAPSLPGLAKSLSKDTHSQVLSIGDQILVPDYRAGVYVSFEVIEDNKSAIKLIQGDDVIDRKMISFSLKKISMNYDTESLEQFCAEWLMPCVSIVESQHTGQLKLQVHGEMLTDLIFK